MHRSILSVLEQTGQIILGHDQPVRLAVACLIAGGHLLVEDLPGVGKTTLVQALARSFGLTFQRVQFTSDLLPGDILGVSIFERESQTFQFHPGPIFNQVLLADEINRATPKTQSALLEAMEEGQVSAEGATRPLPRPFFVIATQNPLEQVGTFPLPESQLDRFLMRISLGYPGFAAERALLTGGDRRALLPNLQALATPEGLLAVQDEVGKVHAADPLLDYLQALIGFTRACDLFKVGLSPRAGLAILRAARAWAWLAGRGFVVPEDIQTILPMVAGHRLHTVPGSDFGGQDPIAWWIAQVATP
ncbi:MAG: AAA family ATPase [Proteobacteria bacterium CG1_02_64_396]|nr:MAG: AAA family ATPase [Proteobacteria bacterium CG1_02_64_396]